MIVKSETVMQGLDIFPGIFLQSGNSKKKNKKTQRCTSYAMHLKSERRVGNAFFSDMET